MLETGPMRRSHSVSSTGFSPPVITGILAHSWAAHGI